MVAESKEELGKAIAKNNPKTIAYFKSTVLGERVNIVRVGNNIGWYWENKKDKKTYGDYIIYKPLVDEKVEKEIKRFKVKMKTANSESEQKRLAAQLLDLTRRYESTKIKDVENAYGVLIDQAEASIQAVINK